MFIRIIFSFGAAGVLYSLEQLIKLFLRRSRHHMQSWARARRYRRFLTNVQMEALQPESLRGRFGIVQLIEYQTGAVTELDAVVPRACTEIRVVNTLGDNQRSTHSDNIMTRSPSEATRCHESHVLNQSINHSSPPAECSTTILKSGRSSGRSPVMQLPLSSTNTGGNMESWSGNARIVEQDNVFANQLEVSEIPECASQQHNGDSQTAASEKIPQGTSLSKDAILDGPSKLRCRDPSAASKEAHHSSTRIPKLARARQQKGVSKENNSKHSSNDPLPMSTNSCTKMAKCSGTNVRVKCTRKKNKRRCIKRKIYRRRRGRIQKRKPATLLRKSRLPETKQQHFDEFQSEKAPPANPLRQNLRKRKLNSNEAETVSPPKKSKTETLKT